MRREGYTDIIEAAQGIVHHLTHKLPFNGQPLVQQTEKGRRKSESLQFPLSSVRISCVAGLTNRMMPVISISKYM